LRPFRFAVLAATLCIGGDCIAAAQIAGPDAPVESADSRALCARAYANHKPGPVTFDESTTTFRSSAVPVLLRIVALANTCRSAAILITGHTDSSGDERWNVRLSLARAEAVADYLEQRGIAAERLIATGAGSSLPIADNATRYGRSLNRRIEFTFIPGSSD
jgi:OOP family OmpA-OmpF porin